MLFSSWGQDKIIKWPVCSGYATDILGDAMIAFEVTRLLMRLCTGFKSINTGALTVLCTVLSLVSTFILPHSFAFLVVYFITGKLYLNSLLGTLNARSRIASPAEWTAPVLTYDVIVQGIPLSDVVLVAAPLEWRLSHDEVAGVCLLSIDGWRQDYC
ncbi:hypothetical protein OBBRIDRAFT_457060 [Obba rivulosa]|uniref:DUF6534 domain-containing protein n=1 Tax=Obba rivulosa TaxID=1052685 RepID=A0A8E2B1R3_9APHY|nr:hypothetical protein OBBRIDRAFT_457060 [Obba rivulosa]